MINRWFSLWALCLLTSFCGPGKKTPFQLREAPDYANAIERFDIDKTFTYDELKKIGAVSLKDVPWTDVYWPLAAKGLAWRWAIDQSSLPDETVKIAGFFRYLTTEAQKPQPDPLLSPAEKYDLAFAYRHKLEIPITELHALDTELVKQDAKIGAEPDLEKKRALLKAMRQTLLASKASSILTMTTNSWAPFLEYSGDAKFKFLAARFSAGEDWWWTGHCHGWAAAAALSQPPRHSVMALLGNQKVFFSEGDIRGLMTKAWADDAPDDNSYFLGRRCKADANDPNKPIEANRLGRGFSGKVTLDGEETPFIFIEDLPILRGVGAQVYRIKLDPSGEEKILVTKYHGGKTSYWITNSFDALAHAFRSHDMSALVAVKATITGCWDTNPASFHALLVEQIATRQVGLMMNRVRNGQVWNQPIYSAAFEIGELKAADAVEDVAAAYRASGTAYVAEVTTKVQWTYEPDVPELSYPASFDRDHLKTTEYLYTLEFDAKKRLIGGDWGTLSALDPAADAPNFLFGFPKGAQPLDALDAASGDVRMDYSGIIAKLHDCSMDKSVDGTLTLQNHQLSYKNCPIDRVVP